jgi:hypothetical protein
VKTTILATLKRQLWKTSLRSTALWKYSKIYLNDRCKGKFLKDIRRSHAFKSDVRILVINHFFDGEIEALTQHLEARQDISFLSVTPEPFFSRALAWFPESVHNAQIPYDAPELETVRARYRSYCEKLYEEIAAIYPFHCILTPSDSFYWLREFIIVCQQRGIPTIVADKEGTITPRSFEVEPLRIRKMFPPISDYFFVWSGRQSTFWLKAGVDASRIEAVGSMRSDLFVTLKPLEPKTLLFFDFDTDAYISNMDWDALAWRGERNWNYLRDAIHRVLLRVARENPQLNIIIKCHPQQAETNFAVAGLTAQPNVNIIKGTLRGLPAMIAEAHAVIGFQTTALLECALAQKHVLYVAWGDLYDVVEPNILPWAKSGYGMKWLRSEEQLESTLRAILQCGLSEECRQVDRSKLSNYFYRADGYVVERLLDRLTRIVGERKPNGIVS